MVFFLQRQVDIAKWEETPKEDRKGIKKPGKVKLPVEPDEPGSIRVSNTPEMGIDEILSHEKSLMKFYISGHPLDVVTEPIQTTIQHLNDNGLNKQKEYIIAIPTQIKEITTKKKKEKMVFLVLEDKTATLECVIFPKIYKSCHNLLDGSPIRCFLELEVIEGESKNITKGKIITISALPSVEARKNSKLVLTVPFDKAVAAAQMMKENAGSNCKVELKVQAKDIIWKFGAFMCNGTKEEFRQKMKEFIRC